jgi:hypothetical protein
MVMPLMALEPDMSGVCSVCGTLLMISTPTNEASTNTTTSVASMEGFRQRVDVPRRDRARRPSP